VTPLDTLSDNFVRAARLDDVRAAGRTSVRVAGHSLALFFHDGKVHALDNRCPHMGFPLLRLETTKYGWISRRGRTVLLTCASA
jgi:nitrite reductase/ring-hydroxylating ferredoxin subunit